MSPAPSRKFRLAVLYLVAAFAAVILCVVLGHKPGGGFDDSTAAVIAAVASAILTMASGIIGYMWGNAREHEHNASVEIAKVGQP